MLALSAFFPSLSGMAPLVAERSGVQVSGVGRERPVMTPVNDTLMACRLGGCGGE